jgi:hypothetical protein
MHCNSCSSSHKEHKKIGFAIFGFFCDLIWILQVAANKTQRGKKPFCEQAPGKIELFTVMPLVCDKAPGITWDLQCGPWTKGTARPVGIRRARWRSWPGKWLGRV